MKLWKNLDIVNKSIVVVYLINGCKIKGRKIYEYLREFKEFRNSYAHGKVAIITTNKEFEKNQVKEKNLKDNRISKDNYEVMFDKSLLEQVNDLMKMCEKYTLIIKYMDEVNMYAEKIYDSIDFDDLNLFIDGIKKRCHIINDNLELDDNVKKSLQLMLDKLYIDIIKV